MHRTMGLAALAFLSLIFMACCCGGGGGTKPDGPAVKRVKAVMDRTKKQLEEDRVAATLADPWIIERYGLPDTDESTENDTPRPPIVTRLLIYKKERVQFTFVPGGKATMGSPPPYTSWTLLGIQDPETSEVLSADEVTKRMTARMATRQKQ